MKTRFTPDWQDWIKTNVDAGNDKDGIFKILLDNDYDYWAIAEQMNYIPSRPADELINPHKVANKTSSVQSTANSPQTSSFPDNHGMPIARSKIYVPNANILKSDELDLRTVDNFLNAAECNRLIDVIKSNMRPSTVGSYEVDTRFRTSQTCDLGQLDDRFVKDIDRRICQLVGIDPRFSEPIQGQHYEVGQEFKAHTDFFDPHEFDLHCSEQGQRTFTVMIYLNTVKAGGETRFRRVNKAFKPRRGLAVVWNSLDEDGSPNMDSIHQSVPVEKGTKTIITKWFRSKSPSLTPEKMLIKTHNEYVPNYTRTGVDKARLPEPLFKKINGFYHENRSSLEEEHVEGDFIVNSDKAVDRNRKSSSVVQMSDEMRLEIHDALKPMMEKWCGKKLEPTYVYGIREYHEGAVLKMHRDRIDTHIISAIINVEQETDVDWPLVIEDNDYRRHHVMIKPGDMIFYEGGRLLHGRPFAFEGKSFANLFCHFKPVDYKAPEMP